MPGSTHVTLGSHLELLSLEQCGKLNTQPKSLVLQPIFSVRVPRSFPSTLTVYTAHIACSIELLGAHYTVAH